MRAAEMIDDAENALRMLEECENEDDFRVLWIACVTILRSIHVCIVQAQISANAISANISVLLQTLDFLSHHRFDPFVPL